MESLSNEVSQKIRSAIKAKLVELGAYVDDELPDYIMVMVANNKTKSQMADDLSLFLGASTTKFTDWLQDVLERLQSVTSDKKKKGDDSSAQRSETVQTEKQPILRPPSYTVAPAVRHEVEKLSFEESYNSDEILAIKADFDGDDDFMDEDLQEELNSIPETNRIIQKQKVSVAPLTSSPKIQLQKKPFTAPITAVLPVKKPTKDVEKTMVSVSGVKRRAPALVRPIPIKRRAPSSTVGAIVHNQVMEDDDDDDDELAFGSVSSVVRVSERRSSIPVERQANKNLIMKAVAEAKKSITDAARRFPLTARDSSKRLGLVQPERNLEIVFPRRETEDNYFGIRKRLSSGRTINISSSSADDLHYDASASNYTLSSDFDDSRMEEEISPIVSPDTSEYLQDRTDEGPDSPKFIVTLDGVNPDLFLAKKKYSVLKGTVPSESSSKSLVKPITINLNDSEEDEEESAETLALLKSMSNFKNQSEKSKERCKYWPACKSGDGCTFHHPVVQCKTFPNCNYGEKCLYIHPNCKFDSSCTKRNCPYTHASKRNLNQPIQKRISRKPMNPAEMKCKFFPRCTNLNCQFFHPRPCRYGLACNQPGCAFTHPPLPAPDKLRWSAFPGASQQFDDGATATGKTTQQ